MTSRDDLITFAAYYVGCAFDTDRDGFLELIALGEAPASAEAMAHDSTCGLFVRGLLAHLGCTDARIVAPYHPGRVMSDLAAMAREAGAVKPLSGVAAGDIVMIEGPEHVFVVESIDGAHWSTLQGGERDTAGAQQIQRIVRTLYAGALGGRPVSLVIDWDAMAERFLAS